jgi:hypothetical protein
VPRDAVVDPTLGNSETWRHAQLIVGGDFTQSVMQDIIVKWSDGEVTLYEGNWKRNYSRPFVGETQLAKPGSIWSHAKLMASFESVGLIVVWSDGEVSLYPRVDNPGFGTEQQLLAPNALWRDHAAHICGMGGAGLRVVWSDGEVSEYTVWGGKLHDERQLLKPNDTWKHVRSLSNVGGLYTMVRWSDGELTAYELDGSGGVGKEHQIKAPNELWTHATVIAGYESTGPGLLVRWSDGELDLYPYLDAMGTEIQLVAP